MRQLPRHSLLINTDGFPVPCLHPSLQDSGVRFIFVSLSGLPFISEIELEFVVEKQNYLNWGKEKPSICFRVLSLFLKGTCFYCLGNPVYC